MTFTGHLGELRTRLVHSGIAVFVGFTVCYIFSNVLIELLASPLAPLQSEIENVDLNPDETSFFEIKEVRWTILNPLELILVKLKMSAYGGLLLAFPYVLYHICGFIFPGLKPQERKLAKISMLGCGVLGTCGAAVAYWGVFPVVLQYLSKFAPDFVDIQFRLNETLSLIMKGLVGFALAFQFPMVVLALVYMGLLTPESLKAYRRVAIVGMFVSAALLTPPDPLTMCMMALPLVLLYESSIWLSYLVVRRNESDPDA